MFVTVIAMNEGHEGARRAGRFFPNGQETVLDVLDQDEDPELVKGANGTLVPDPTRIGKKSLEALKRDMRIKIVGDAATQSGLSRAAYDEARRRAQSAAGDLEGAKLEIARLEDENKTLRARVTELEGGKAAPHAPAKPGEHGHAHPATPPASPALVPGSDEDSPPEKRTRK